MTELLGMLSGLLILGLAAALLTAALVKAGSVKPETAALFHASGLMCFFGAAVYYAFAQLLHGVLEAKMILYPIRELFPSSGLRRAFESLETGENILSLPGHLLGQVFSGNRTAGGLFVSFLLTLVSLFLMMRAVHRLRDEKAACRFGLLLLSLPGMFLCFLPGWGAFALLGISILFSVCLPLLPDRGRSFSPRLWEGALAVFSLLSAAVMTACVMGAFP